MLIKSTKREDQAPIKPGWQIDAAGWCEAATRQASPNFGPRPSATTISMLVIHNISLPLGVYGGDFVPQLFLNQLDCDVHPSFASLKDLRVSTHFFISRLGELHQFVSCLERAWHAGVSHFEGRDGCNDFSIGIELEGCDADAFLPAQYLCLRDLCSSLIAHFPIEVMVGHSDIAPGRKTDPGPHFDWQALRTNLPGWQSKV